MIDSSLPLTDIHRHLDGNIRAQTILDLGREFNIALPASTLDTLRPHVQVTSLEPDLVSFLAKLDWGVKVLASLEACRRVAYENVEDAARNGLHYVELRFSPRYMAMTHQLPVDGVVEAVIAGVREGSRDFQVDARLIGILSRTFGEAACQEELAALLAARASPRWIWPVMSWASRARCSSTILIRPATLAGILPSTLAKRPDRKVSGRPSASWARSASVMGSKR
jgi:adenosine deaminase